MSIGRIPSLSSFALTSELIFSRTFQGGILCFWFLRPPRIINVQRSDPAEGLNMMQCWNITEHCIPGAHMRGYTADPCLMPGKPVTLIYRAGSNVGPELEMKMLRSIFPSSNMSLKPTRTLNKAMSLSSWPKASTCPRRLSNPSLLTCCPSFHVFVTSGVSMQPATEDHTY